MRLELFIKEKEQIEKKSIEEQKAFYQNWLEKEQKKSDIRILACFSYAKLFYQEGNFRKTRDILEPFVIDYQSYAYIPEMISCFNLMGVAAHCETEYYLSRYFYSTALKIARETMQDVPTMPELVLGWLLCDRLLKKWVAVSW